MRRAGTIAGVTLGAAAAAAVPWLVARARRTRREAAGEAGAISTSLTVLRPAEEVYAAWRRLEDLPRYLRHVEAVERLDERRSRWTARAPGGAVVSWEAEIVEEEPGRRLAWRSLAGSEVRHTGEIEVRPGAGRGSVVQALLRVEAGGSPTGTGAAVLEPITRRTLVEDLRRFKNLMEAGEIPTHEGQSAGERSRFAPRNPF